MNFKQINSGVLKIIAKATEIDNSLEIDQEIKGIFNILNEKQEKSIEEAYTRLNEELSVSHLGIIYLGYLSITTEVFEPFKSDWGGRMNSNFDISSVLTQVTNFSLSIVKLIEQGLDLQAKVLLRSLFEVINTLIIITSKEEMMKKYCEGVDEYTSNSVWSNTFRQNQVKKLLSKIESDLGLREDKELLQYLKEEKDNTYRFLSSITHGSYYSNILESYSQYKDEEFMPLVLFGEYTDASIPSLQQLNWLIYYLTIMLDSIRKQIHRFERPKTNQDLYKTCELLKSIFINTYFRYLDVKEQEK